MRMMSQFKQRPFRKTANRRERRPAYEAVEIHISPGLPPHAGVLKDISTGGAHLHVFAAENLPRSFALGIPVLKTTVDCKVRWRKGDRLGVEFARIVDLAAMPRRPKVDRREIIAAHFRGRLRLAQT